MEKPNNGKSDKRSDQRNRHGDQRNERGAPALQENENDDDDKHQRLDQRLLDFVHARRDGERSIQSDGVVKSGRKTFLRFRHELLGAVAA